MRARRGCCRANGFRRVAQCCLDGRVIADELRPSASDIRTARDVGITSVLVAPSRGAFRGLSALVPLRDESAAQYVVKSPVALHMGFQGVQGSGFGGRYPATLLGVIAYERQALYDARHHRCCRIGSCRHARAARQSYDAISPLVRSARALPAFSPPSRERHAGCPCHLDEFDLKLTTSRDGGSPRLRLSSAPSASCRGFPADRLTVW